MGRCLTCRYRRHCAIYEDAALLSQIAVSIVSDMSLPRRSEWSVMHVPHGFI